MGKTTVQMGFIEKLIRDSERLAVVTAYVKENKYISKEDLCAILGLEKECEE